MAVSGLGGTGSGDVIKLASSRTDDTIVFDDEPSDAGSSHSFTEGGMQGPTKVGRYIVLDVIGVGGMGVVCTAYDPKLDRKVALKLLRRPGKQGSGRSSMGRARLLREAQALAKLSHPNIITVHDVDTTPDGRLYMAMEFVEGETLGHWLSARTRDWREVLTTFSHAGRGLAAAHAAGITHRDFKPENVLIGDDGRVRVLDFGLAKSGDGDGTRNTDPSDVESSVGEDLGIAETDARLTRVGRVVGTPAYMAPEQRRGKPVGPNTDQFGFAVALFEGLYGFLPFSSEGSYAAARKGRITEPPKDVRVPAWVLRVLRRALSPDPTHRYPSMDGLLAALQADPAKRRRKAMAWLGGGVTAALAGVELFNMFAPDEAACHGARERVDATWNDARRADVEDALRGTGTAYADYTAGRVLSAFDDYAKKWSEARVEVCEATRVHTEQSEALMDTRMICLDRRQSAFAALVHVLADADEKVAERAVAAAYTLPTPGDCTTAIPGADNDLPTDATERQVVLAVHAKIDEANALISAGRYVEAQAVATAARNDAEAAGHRPTLARATLFDGIAAYFGHDYERAEEKLSAAGIIGAEVGNRKIEARAWTKLIYVTGAGLHKPERGVAWLTAAEAAVASLEDPGVLRVDLFTESASTHLESGHVDEAIEAFRSALAAIESGEGESPTLSYVPRSNLGIALARAGKFTEAETMLRKAMDDAATVFGERHPRVASVAQNLGNVLVYRKKFTDARPVLERALEIRIALFGVGHPRAVEIEVALARVDRSEGRYDDAIVRLSRAVGSFRRAGKDRHVATALNNLGSVHLEAKDPALAHASFTAARSLIAGGAVARPLQLATTDRLLCEASLGRDDLTAARAECASSRGLFEAAEQNDSRDLGLAEVQVLSANVAAMRGRPAAALAFAKRAVDAASSVDPAPDVLAEATALLVKLAER